MGGFQDRKIQTLAGDFRHTGNGDPRANEDYAERHYGAGMPTTSQLFTRRCQGSGCTIMIDHGQYCQECGS